MKEWLGKAYDYLYIKSGGFGIPNRWTKYKSWQDFMYGRWFPVPELELLESWSDPEHKFLWWKLRFAEAVAKILLDIVGAICLKRYPNFVVYIKVNFWKRFKTWLEYSAYTKGRWNIRRA